MQDHSTLEGRSMLQEPMTEIQHDLPQGILRVMAYLKDLKPSTETREISKEYQQYIRLFAKQDNTKLPIYTKWDHEIPLKPSIEPFYQKIYELNERQLEILQQYLQ